MVPDPRSVKRLKAGLLLCRQLGLELCPLSSELPLYDGVTGALVSQEQDRRIEQLRDALMDAARSRVEDLGEGAVAGGPRPPRPPPSKLCLQSAI